MNVLSNKYWTALFSLFLGLVFIVFVFSIAQSSFAQTDNKTKTSVIIIDRSKFLQEFDESFLKSHELKKETRRLLEEHLIGGSYSEKNTWHDKT